MATQSSILARKFRGQRSLADYSPWDLKELNMTECVVRAHACTHIHAHSELTDWICRKRERTEPEIKLCFPAQMAEQMKCLLKERGSQERWQVQS